MLMRRIKAVTGAHGYMTTPQRAGENIRINVFFMGANHLSEVTDWIGQSAK